LDPTLLFDYKTINEFSTYLAEEYQDAFENYFAREIGNKKEVDQPEFEAAEKKNREKIEDKKTGMESLQGEIARIFANELIDKLEFREEDIDFDANLMDYGFDSVFAVQMMKVYEETINVSLDPTLLFDYKTINEFSAYLAGEYETQFRQYFNHQVTVEKPEKNEPNIPIPGPKNENRGNNPSRLELPPENPKNKRPGGKKPLLRGKKVLA